MYQLIGGKDQLTGRKNELTGLYGLLPRWDVQLNGSGGGGGKNHLICQKGSVNTVERISFIVCGSSQLIGQDESADRAKSLS
jgi:hypothetical protein